jgi:hypothetical protein
VQYNSSTRSSPGMPPARKVKCQQQQARQKSVYAHVHAKMHRDLQQQRYSRRS